MAARSIRGQARDATSTSVLSRLAPVLLGSTAFDLVPRKMEQDNG